MDLRSFTLLLIFMLTNINIVNPIGNDVHLYEGSSMAEIVGGDLFFEVLEPLELRYSYRIRPAKDFGAQFNDSTSFKGARLVPTEPLDGCSIINHEDVAGHIAFSERGECSFVYKTARAQEAGARAIIITDQKNKWDDALNHLIEMIDDKSNLDVKIPAAFILGRSGGTILQTLHKLKKKYAIINIPVNMTYVNLNKMKQPPWISL